MATLPCELYVPVSVCGIALAEPRVLSRKNDGYMIFIIEHLRIWILLLVTFCIQLLFVFELRYIEHGETTVLMTCSNEFVLLEFVCVYVFEVFMFAEIRGSLNLFRLIWYATPHNNDYVAMTQWGGDGTQSAEGAILHNMPERGFLMRALKNFRRTHSSHSEVLHVKPWTLAGMRTATKVFLFLMVAFPKLILSVGTAYVGGLYIMCEGSGASGQREALLFSTLAVNFIGDFDHVLFEAFTSQPVKYQLENMDPVVVELTQLQCTIYWLMSAIVYPSMLFVGSVYLVYYYKRKHCDSYQPPWAEDATDFRWPWEDLLKVGSHGELL